MRRLAFDRRGVVAAEFAICGSLVVLVLLLVFVVGLMGWTKVAMQAGAASTARCAALGSSACSTPASYAVSQVNGWLFSGAIAVGDVTVTNSTSCNGATGHYTKVVISSSGWSSALPSGLPTPLSTPALSTTSCYVSGL